MNSSSFPLICSHSKCRTMTAPPSPLLTDESSPLKGRRQSYQDTFFGYENLPPSQILILIQFSITKKGQKGRKTGGKKQDWWLCRYEIPAMTIKFPRRKHLANYIGCHITGTIYSRAQIRQITFALQLKNYHMENVVRIFFKHPQTFPQLWNVCIWKQNLLQN